MITRRPITCSILSLLLLASCALTGPEVPERIVRVKILADPKLRAGNPDWVEEVRGLVRAASDYFEREYGIRFVAANVAPWTPEETSPFTAVLLTELKEKFPLKDRNGTYDLVIGFTRERVNVYFGGRARVDRIGNCQEGLGNYLVTFVSNPFHYRGPHAEPDLDVVALIHELGHIFGAEHVQDPGSIMHEGFDYRTEFDRKNRRTIFKNKFCPFGK